MVSFSLPSSSTTLVAAIPVAYLLYRTLAARSASRSKRIAPTEERVLILGASSGVGRVLAKQYAARGARVCVVARRADQISSLVADCGGRCLGQVADFTNPEELVQVREAILNAWGGLDTVHISAGVSALRPILGLVGLEESTELDASSEAIQNAMEMANKAVQGNFTGPLASALTFIPMLVRTSSAPAVLLVSSLAAKIPAPTRGLYGATKASSLLLFQALAIEHPGIAFSHMIPSTIEGNFRASAVDAGPVREANPNKAGLKLDYVAQQCVRAVDTEQRGNIFLPWFPYVFTPFLYQIWPSFIERKAREKYNFLGKP